MSGNVETEFKLRTPRPIEVALVDAAVRESAFECSAAGSRRHNDIYLDDTQRSLARIGVGLRIRVDRRGSTVTCKSRGQRDGALFVREEREAPWPSPTTPPTAAELPLQLRDAVEPVLLRRPLVPVLRLDVARDVRRLRYDDKDLAELAIDHVQAHGAGRSVRFTEIELEVAEDVPTCEKLAEHLEQTLQVQAASNDKPTHAARLLGLAAPDGPQPADPSTPTATAIAATMRRLIGAVQRAETGVRQSHDEQHVHLMRTSLRRLRSVVAAFRDLWPASEGRWLRAHLRALAGELGRVRDLDVMTAMLPADVEKLSPALRPGAERVLEWLRASCAAAHRDLASWLRSPQRLDDAQRFLDLAFELDEAGEVADAPIASATKERLAASARRLRRRTRELSESSPIEDFHAARIAGKRVRYLVEELGEFSDLPLRKTRKRLRRVQEAIGSLCDGDRLIHHLVDQVGPITTDCADEPLAGPALGALIERRFAATERRRPAAVEAIRAARRRLHLPG